ncbi:MAG: hypothetical protein VX278_09135 [Myxococcota bacterium]|nr:hypothetical protein [Myxococcota bacterium]
MQRAMSEQKSISQIVPQDYLSMEITQALITEDTLIEVQGVTLDRSPLRVAGIYAFLNLIAGSLFWFWPIGASLLSVAILYSTIQDLRGLKGWVRNYLLKDIGINVLSWHTNRIPDSHDWTPPNTNGLILAIPLNKYDKKDAVAHGIILLFSMLPPLCGILTLLKLPLVIVWSMLSLFIVACLLFGFQPVQSETREKLPEYHHMIQEAWRSKERPLRLTCVFYENGFNAGALSTFLINFRRFVAPSHNRVLFLKEGSETCLFAPKTLVTRSSADSVWLQLQEKLNVPVQTIHDPAATSQALGWSSRSLSLPFEKESLQALFDALDSMETEWSSS